MHIFRVTDVPYIIYNIKFAHSCTVYVGLAQARPNNIIIMAGSFESTRTVLF